MRSKILRIGLIAAALGLTAAVAVACGGESCCPKHASHHPRAGGVGQHPDHGPAEQGVAPQSSVAVQEPLKTVLDNYLQIQRALANDSLKGVAQSAGAISQAVQGAEANRLSAKIGDAAQKLQSAQNVKTARQSLKELSEPLIDHARTQNVAGLRVAYCPMAKASWLQSESRLNNPYMGRSMPECGEFKN